VIFIILHQSGFELCIQFAKLKSETSLINRNTIWIA